MGVGGDEGGQLTGEGVLLGEGGGRKPGVGDRVDGARDALDVDEDDGDVVLAAVGVGDVDELAGAGGEVEAVGGDDLEDLLVAEHPVEAVGTEDVDVAGLGLVRLEVDDDILLHAEGAGDDVLGEVGLLLVGEVGDGGDVVVHQRVVAGEQLDLPLAHPVAAAIAHVADEDLALAGGEHRADHGGPHAVALPRLLAAVEDLPVRHPDAGEQAVLLLGQVGVEVEGPGDVLVGRGAEELGDGVGGDAAGHVAGLVPAHAVGHNKKPVLVEHREAVLVVLALHPSVGQAVGDGPEFWGR